MTSQYPGVDVNKIMLRSLYETFLFDHDDVIIHQLSSKYDDDGI